MILNYRFVAISLVYAMVLTWVYLVEITVQWAYMGFIGDYSLRGLLLVIAGTIILSVITRGEDVRAYILTSLIFIFFIPSLIFAAFAVNPLIHLIALSLMIALVYLMSALRVPVIKIGSPSRRAFLNGVFLAVLSAVAIQAAFGGLRYFNLDLDQVYDFRAAAAAELPPLFGYLYSNVSTVLVPIALLLAIRNNNIPIAVGVLVSSVILFGMTQHKTVLFGPFAVLFLYFFYRKSPRLWMIGLAFFAMPLLSFVEVLIDHYVYNSISYSYFTALFTRRVLFFPPVLDGSYIEYFGVNEKFYWSASQVGGLFTSNRYGVSPPFVIGYEYFANADTSANTGLVGSGFANAGLVGVGIYSAISGLLIAYLNIYGRKLDPGLVTAVSLLTVFNIFTSADLLTAFLTHGALLLLILLTIFPPSIASENSKPQLALA